MKVLMTTDTVGGVWNYSLELCKELEKYDVQIHLAAMGAWPSRQQREQISQCENVILYKSDFKLEWMQDPWDDVEKSHKWINSIYHTIQPDLIHLNNYVQRDEDWNCPVVTVFHSCVTSWWQAVKGTALPSSWEAYSKMVKNSLNKSDMVVSPTKAIIEKAKDFHNITVPTKVIYNGKAMEFEEEVEKENFLLCTGRIWDEGKNLRLLSKIAQNLPWPVYIAGNNVNPNTGNICEVENVHFLGKLEPEELKLWMQRAEIFVSPTKYEPFGLSILEAAKAGCALALSNIDTLQELWHGNAIFFDPENAGEAEKVILELISDKDFRDKMASRSKKAAETYCSKKMSSEYFELYKSLINSKKSEENLVGHDL